MTNNSQLECNITEPVIISYKSPIKSTFIYKSIKKTLGLLFQEDLIPFIISLLFIFFFIVWLFFSISPPIIEKSLKKMAKKNDTAELVNIQQDDQLPAYGLPPDAGVNDLYSTSKKAATSKDKKIINYILNIIKVSKGLSYYFHYQNGLFAVIISVILLIYLTILISYYHYRNFKTKIMAIDCIGFRWVEILPQFFILLVSIHILKFYLKPEHKATPFIWSLIICWTMGPYFFRQLYPHVASFFKNRVYDAELIIGEKESVIWLRYLIGQHCLSVILVLICYVIGNLILIESCMAYLIRFTNQGEFPSLGGILAQAYAEVENYGKRGLDIFKNISTEGLMSICVIFSGVICFNVISRFIEIYQKIRKQMVWG